MLSDNSCLGCALKGSEVSAGMDGWLLELPFPSLSLAITHREKVPTELEGMERKEGSIPSVFIKALINIKNTLP